MHETRPAKITSPILSLSDDYVKMIPMALIVGAVGIAISLFMSFGSESGFKHFAFAYLTNFCFLLTITLGCLFFVIIVNLTRAGWSATVRRIAELLAMCIVPMFILALPIVIPVILQQDILYSWNNTGWSEEGAAELTPAVVSPLEQAKSAYLNWWFFTGRVVAYFVIWGAMAWFFLGNSLKQDKTGEKNLSLKMQKFSAPIMILFAATLVFSSFDFEMSLAPLWFSTMFPVYFFAGSFLGGLAMICLTSLLLQRSGRVTDEITVDHYHDLAKLMFSFVFFWGYIGFSQFMLIWYANIPEETFWYNYRINFDGWRAFSLILLFGHLFIPFLGLMARTVRRNKTYLLFASIYILVFHWVDHYWLVMPQMKADHAFTFNPLVDLPCVIGMIGLYAAMFCLIARDRPLVALQDPRLGEALNFKNP
jgi:hypothetical protein